MRHDRLHSLLAMGHSLNCWVCPLLVLCDLWGSEEVMAIPTDKLAFTPSMLEAMMREFQPRPAQTLFASRGFLDQAQKEFKIIGGERSNPLFDGGMAYNSIPYVTHEIPKKEVLDWSSCRSPARAMRRHKQGHPQRVKVTYEEVAYLINGGLAGFMNTFEAMALKTIMGEK